MGKTSFILCIFLTACLAGCVRSHRDEWAAEHQDDPAETTTPPSNDPASTLAAPTLHISREEAATCAAFDPVRRPGDVVKIIEYASAKSGVPDGLLYGIWQTESGEVYGDRGGAGNVSAVQQYRIRTRWHHGDGPGQLAAIKKMGSVYGWEWQTLLGSRGRSTMETRGRSFGGCIGPMQITPTEWLQEPDWQRHDPLKLCDAMILTGRRLKRDHDAFMAHHRGANTQRAWLQAIEQYSGGAGSSSSYRYYAHVVNGRDPRRPDSWRDWNRAQKASNFDAIIARAKRRGRKWRHNDEYASR